MATSIIKTDEIRRLNDQVLMSDGVLSGNVVFPAGHVINITHFQNSTRTTVPSSGQTLPYVLWNAGTFNKKITNSFLFIEAQLPFLNGNSYDFGPFCRVGGSSGTIHYDGVVFSHYSSDGLTSTDTIKTALHYRVYHYESNLSGSVQLEFGWNPSNASTGDRPGDVWNPNSSDNARSRQWTSDAYVWEIVYS